MSEDNDTVAKKAEIMKRPDFLDLFGNCPRTRHASAATPAASFPSKPSETTTRDDIVFISSRDNGASTLWVNYLTACFEQISRQQDKPPFRVLQLMFEEQLSPGTDLRIRNSRLQIIVVCPILLERVAERPDQATALTRLLNTDRVLAMMLGVQDSHLSASQRSSLVTYSTWRKFFVKDQDETFVGHLLGAAVTILGNASANNLKLDKTGFSVYPKKVKTGHNRILALLNEPLHPEDNVTVIVDRCGDALEIGHVTRRNPYTLKFAIPESCLEASMIVGIRVLRNNTPLGVRQVKCESRLRELDQILRAHDNPLEFMCQTCGFHPGDKDQLDNWMVHSFQKNIPPHFNLLAPRPGDLQLPKNYSKSKSTGSEENPTLLHFAARFGLEKLAWQLLECPGGDIACDMRNINDLTPADLAEQAGHQKLAHQLRGYMQMNEFSNMYSYLKVMSENTNKSSNGYRLPNQSERQPQHQYSTPTPTSAEDDIFSHQQQEDYCRPRPLSEAYSVPPVARPVSSRHFPDYSTPPPLPFPNNFNGSNNINLTATGSEVGSDSATPTTPLFASTIPNSSGLEMPLQIASYAQIIRSEGLRTPDSACSTPTVASLTSSSSSHFFSNQPPGNNENNNTPSSDIGTKSNSEPGTTPIGQQSSAKSNHSSKTNRECEPQDELLEIITDFKNNVFTISEVERLVENWRNRNDVQQSVKEKQRQLSAMRDEYERIQKRIKDEMKAPTPFDRIKKFFVKGKKDSKDSAGSSSGEDALTTQSKQNVVNGNLADRRPVSNLSLHSVSSSSSSGRMSTVSGCSNASLGDSGTHSDTDDRRHAIPEDKSSNYEIPPAPKPFHGRTPVQYHQSQSSFSTSTGTKTTPTPVRPSELDLRPVKSSQSILDDKDYYIEFPPSGLPVHSFKHSNGKELKTPPPTPVDFPSATANIEPSSPSNKVYFNNNNINYANMLPITPPPGMCIPFQHMNISTGEPLMNKLAVISSDSGNVLTVQPEIHPEPSSCNQLQIQTVATTTMTTTTATPDGESSSENENNEAGKTPEPESPKVLNTDHERQEETDNRPDYVNVQVAASEDIARNFGVTLKKLPVPPVQQRCCEFNFTAAEGDNCPSAENGDGENDATD